MKRAGTIALCLVSGLTLGVSLRAEDAALPGNPYAVVVARNIFGLNPPPVVDPNAVVVEPPVKIIPNGIMSIFGNLQVLFKVAAKPGGKDASYILMEGQRQDEIEVTKINEKAGIVTFNNHGIVQELPLVVTAPTPTPSQPTGGRPGMPTIAPGIAPGAVGGNPGNSPFMNRFGNRGGQSGGGNNATGGGNNGANLRNVPTRGGDTGNSQRGNLSAEEQTIILAAQHAKLQQEGNPAAAIFPPTVIDAEAGVVPTPAPPGPPGF